MIVADVLFRRRLLAALKSGEWYLSADGEYLVVPVRALSNNKTETSSFVRTIERLDLGRYGVTTRKGVGSFRAFFIKIFRLSALGEDFEKFLGENMNTPATKRISRQEAGR